MERATNAAVENSCAKPLATTKVGHSNGDPVMKICVWGELIQCPALSMQLPPIALDGRRGTLGLESEGGVSHEEILS